MDGIEAALIKGHVVADQAAEAVDDRGIGDSAGSVQVSVDFGVGSGEVEDRIAGEGVDGDFERYS